MADLTTSRRPVDPYPGVTLKARRIQLNIEAVKLDISRAEVEILEHLEVIQQREGTIVVLQGKVAELEAALNDS